MAITLQSLATPQAKPVIATILGEAGVGKTTLAATFPSPVIIPVEDGLQALEGKNIPAFPLCTSSAQVFECIAALDNDANEFKTVIVDSVTRFNEIIEKEIVESDDKNPASINQALGGYGAGHQAVAQKHRTLRDALGYLRDERGMHVVVIAHADTDTVELPDTDMFQRYTLRMNKKSVSAYVDNVDLVGLLRLKTYTRGDGEKKKATSDGTVELVCHPQASSVSKNRYGIKAPLIVEEGVNPLVDVISSLKS